MTAIQRIIDSIPEDAFLGVMATDIGPYSPRCCVVCRLFSPDEPYRWIETGDVLPFVRAAEELGLPAADMRFLYYAAANTLGAVERAIADRLNRLVPA